MDTPGGEVGFWGAIGIAISATVAQVGIFYRQRRNALLKKSVDEEVILENKDNRAFQFLVRRLDAAEAAHSACEARNDELAGTITKLSRRLDRAIYRQDILRSTLERAGIPCPPLPELDPSSA